MLIEIRTFGTDGHELDSLARYVVQRFVYIGNLVEAHFAAVGSRQSLAGYYFQQEHEFQAIPEVVLDRFDGGAGLAKMRIAPCCEGLKKIKIKNIKFMLILCIRNIIYVALFSSNDTLREQFLSSNKNIPMN